MKTAVVFDSAGTLLHTYRTARDVINDRIIPEIETTTLTCSVKGRALIILYAGSQDIINADGDRLLSDYITANNIEFGLACSSGVVTIDEISKILHTDTHAKVSDLQTCIRNVWNFCKSLEVVAMNSGVIVNKNTGIIEFTITSGGKPFSNARDTIQKLHGMGVATYIASGDRTDKLLKMADYLGIPHENVHGISTPQIKAQIVRDLKDEYDRVIMVGDGVNDIAAMKEADLAVLSEQQFFKKPKMLTDAADVIIRDVIEVIDIVGDTDRDSAGDDNGIKGGNGGNNNCKGGVRSGEGSVENRCKNSCRGKTD
ncbi:MAG: HAD family hydrolase [Methanomicrobium sp.]|nr:HAD family hydrolase [Methanomicrobium sp.]MBR6011182.1 HAD family hydrolase [Methanomicrobium sp.]